MTKKINIDENQIIRYLGFAFIPIAVVIGLILYYRENSLEFQKREYFEFRNSKYSSTVKKKLNQQNKSKPGDIYLVNGIKLRVSANVYNKLIVGDSVIKKSKSDSIFYYTKNELIIKDENYFRRVKYLKLTK